MPAVDRTQEFRDRLGETVGRLPRENVGLAAFSTFGIGGPADLFFDAESADNLAVAVSTAAREKYPFYVIGGGSNILFDDAGFRGLIIRNKAEGITLGKTTLSILSGTGIGRIVERAAAEGRSGLEFLAGIPGTAGGALFGNAGAFGRAIGDILEEAVVLEGGGATRRMTREDFGFEYRRSSLRESRAVVLSAVLAAPPGDPEAAKKRIREILDRRRLRHPPRGTACAGSYFKNPCLPGAGKVAAGQLLEQAGARGMSVGGAAVWEGHCNFIVNMGGARAADVLALAGQLREKVYERFEVRLEEEVIYLQAAPAAA